MKNNKGFRVVCLLFLGYLIFVISSVSVFAIQNDGSTEVIAHIETLPTEATQPVTDSTNSSVTYDESTVSTGDIISGCAIISFALFVLSILIIFRYNENGS